jgi:serine/threonine protein phosphatase PrpC
LGSREMLEDRFLLPTEVSFKGRKGDQKGLLFGVFDGCNDQGKVGDYLSQHSSHHLAKSLNRLLEKSQSISDEVVTNAFAETFYSLSNSCRKVGLLGSATASCAFLVGRKIYFSNVGDSRIILVKPDATYQLTEDAKMRNERFHGWHIKAKNELERDLDGTIRVGPEGEAKYIGRNIGREVGGNKWMCSRPKITRIYYGDGRDEIRNGIIYCTRGDYLVIASNGLFEAATVEEVGQAVRKLSMVGISAQGIAAQLANQVGRLKDNDNVTVLVTAL